MSWWSASERVVQVNSREMERARLERKFVDRLNALAKEKDAEVEAKAAERLPVVMLQHEADVAAYRFEFRRFGDFLLAMITRGGKSSTAINLAAVTAIQVSAGEEPGTMRRLRYAAQATRDGVTRHGIRMPPDDDWVLSVEPRYRSVDDDCWPRTIFVPEPTPPGRSNVIMTTGGGGFSNAYYGDLCIQPDAKFPGLAMDDRVVFRGNGTTIYTPFGLGEKVRDAMLEAIAAGYDAPKIDL